MLNRSYHGNGGFTVESLNTTPLALMGNPFVAAALRANTSAQEGLGTLGSEWQSFVGRQNQQYFALIKRLSQSRTSDQVVSAYTDFWHQLAESYGKELATLTKLMTGVTGKMVMAVRVDPEGPHIARSSQAPVRHEGSLRHRRLRRRSRSY